VFKVCARCGQEYQSWATECADCRVPLDLADSPPSDPKKPLLATGDLVVLRLGGRWVGRSELQGLAEALSARGILSRIDGYPPGRSIPNPDDPQTAGGEDASGFATQVGLYVGLADLEAARAISDELVARELPDPVAEPPSDPNACPACGAPTPENAPACSACGLEFPEAPA